jgi:hypothetical protein
LCGWFLGEVGEALGFFSWSLLVFSFGLWCSRFRQKASVLFSAFCCLANAFLHSFFMAFMPLGACRHLSLPGFFVHQSPKSK